MVLAFTIRQLIITCLSNICDTLLNLVPFVQFKKREKKPAGFSNFTKVKLLKPATLLKVTLLHGCFSRFLNCTNGTKSCKALHRTNVQFFS